MKEKIKYTDEKMLIGERVMHLLPSTAQLVKRKPTVKITLEVTQESLSFFKKQSKRAGVPYQRMIRGFIDALRDNLKTASNTKVYHELAH